MLSLTSALCTFHVLIPSSLLSCIYSSLKFSDKTPESAQDLIRSLLKFNSDQRLGYKAVGEVMGHRFFQGKTNSFSLFVGVLRCKIPFHVLI